MEEGRNKVTEGAVETFCQAICIASVLDNEDTDLTYPINQHKIFN